MFFLLAKDEPRLQHTILNINGSAKGGGSSDSQLLQKRISAEKDSSGL